MSRRNRTKKERKQIKVQEESKGIRQNERKQLEVQEELGRKRESKQIEV
jgi:hypothetical protein